MSENLLQQIHRLTISLSILLYLHTVGDRVWEVLDVQSHQVDNVTAQHLFHTMMHHRKGEVVSVDQNELIQQWLTCFLHYQMLFVLSSSQFHELAVVTQQTQK